MFSSCSPSGITGPLLNKDNHAPVRTEDGTSLGIFSNNSLDATGSHIDGSSNHCSACFHHGCRDGDCRVGHSHHGTTTQGGNQDQETDALLMTVHFPPLSANRACGSGHAPSRPGRKRTVSAGGAGRGLEKAGVARPLSGIHHLLLHLLDFVHVLIGQLDHPVHFLSLANFGRLAN